MDFKARQGGRDRSTLRKRFIIAGGGTGGHLFPGLAIARCLEKRLPGADILYVVGNRPMETEILAGYGYATRKVDIEGLKGRGWRKGIGVAAKIPRSLLQAGRAIRRFDPGFILGMGAYSAGPVCVAGKLMGVPTAIHEQNSYPGLTNRLLAPWVDRVLISFEESRDHLRGKAICLTGNPVREELLAAGGRSVTKTGPPAVLVVGGSQGARAINVAFLEALVVLQAAGRAPEVLHQTGGVDEQRIRQAYAAQGLQGEVVAFIQEMATAYARADLVVSRAGATTIFELAAMGKPSVLIPYPHAANRHQDSNAQRLAERGAAEIIGQEELSGERLAETIMRLTADRARLQRMGERARSLARPDAATRIVEQLLAIGR